MKLLKTHTTLLKGLLLFVLVISPSVSISKINHQTGVKNDTPFIAQISKKNESISVKASDIVPASERVNYISYTCDESYHKTLLKSINAYRSQNGILDATLDAQLNSVACAHSQWMSKNNTLHHKGYDDTGYRVRCLRAETACNSETIMKTTIDTTDDIFEQLVSSDEEQAKLLDPDNKNIGFGYVNGYFTVEYR